MWSRVRLRPYLSTASLPARKPSPYADEESDSIWCLKNSPNFFSKWDLVPFFDDDDDVVDEEEAELDAVLLPRPDITSESSHIWASTWQMPSSTSGGRVRNPVNTKHCKQILGGHLQPLTQYQTFQIHSEEGYLPPTQHTTTHTHTHNPKCTTQNCGCNLQRVQTDQNIHRYILSTSPCYSNAKMDTDMNIQIHIWPVHNIDIYKFFWSRTWIFIYWIRIFRISVTESCCHTHYFEIWFIFMSINFFKNTTQPNTSEYEIFSLSSSSICL